MSDKKTDFILYSGIKHEIIMEAWERKLEEWDRELNDKIMSKGNSATKKAGKAASATAGKPGKPQKASVAETSQKKKEGPVASGGV